MLAAVLTGCSSLRPGRQAQVTIDLYSGRADNPTWTLSPADTQTFLDRLADLKSINHAEPPPGNLGYRGLVVEMEGPSQRLRAFRGVVASENGEVASYADPERSIELWLLSTGSQQLEPSLYESIRSTVAQPQ